MYRSDRPPGIALITTLSVGAILTGLAIALLILYFGAYRSQRLQQQALQAYWNARSGVDRFSLDHILPEKGSYDWGQSDRCTVTRKKSGDLIFQGESGSVSRTIVLRQGDPSQAMELSQ